MGEQISGVWGKLPAHPNEKPPGTVDLSLPGTGGFPLRRTDFSPLKNFSMMVDNATECLTPSPVEIEGPYAGVRFTAEIGPKGMEDPKLAVELQAGPNKFTQCLTKGIVGGATVTPFSPK